MVGVELSGSALLTGPSHHSQDSETICQENVSNILLISLFFGMQNAILNSSL